MLLFKSCLVFSYLVTMFAIPGDYYCSMPQWEAIQGTVVGTYSNGAPHVMARNTEVSYDFNNSMIATTTYITQDGQRVQVKNIYNYEQKILYAIKGDSCSKIMLDEPFRKACVPRNFSITMTKTYYGMGYFGENDHLFIFEYQGKVNDLKYILQTSQMSDPVFEQVYGVSEGASVFSNSAYYNMTAGIKNPDVFHPPSSCMGLKLQINHAAIPKRIGLMTF